MERSIVHLDADAFFASVEQASDSRLRGRPVAVGGEKRGIIASASYEARKFGVYTPMPTARARRLCPKLVVLSGDFEKYERFSRWMFSYAYDFTPDVEVSSVDEGYFDVTGSRKTPIQIAESIRHAIRQSLKLTVSEGIASNKLVSQIASKLNKPSAFSCVPMGGERAFMHPLANRWLPGIGPKTAVRLNAAGLTLIGQIAAMPLDSLSLLLGRTAPQLRDFANGLDERPVIPLAPEAQSYSRQETFEADTTDEELIEAVLRQMADRLMATVRADGKSIRTVTVRVRYNDMAEDQRSESMEEPTDLEMDIYSRLRPMLRQAWKRRVSLRMVSLKFSQVYNGFFRSELPLELHARQHEDHRRLAGVIQDLRRAYGPRAVMRGHDLLLTQAKAARPARVKVAATIPTRTSHVGSSQPKQAFVPLHAHSYYSFLDSTLSPCEIVRLAVKRGLSAVALTDRGNLHGAVEFMQAAKEAGIHGVLGVELALKGSELRLYVENARGYGNLCRILNQSPHIDLERSDTGGLLAVGADSDFARWFPGRFYREVSCAREFERHASTPSLASSPIHYAERGDRWKDRVVQSIRTLTLLRQEHPEKRPRGEFHFPSVEEMAGRFKGEAHLLTRTQEIAGRCRFDFETGKPQFPAFVPPDGSSPHDFLRQRVMQGLRRRYRDRAEKHHAQVELELAIIGEVGYEEYFLVVWDLLQECRRRGIEWITRGSAADSLVCYCLGISDVCPIRFDLYFHRFLNRERMKLNKLPDIDVDFPHDRKDDVVDMIFARYGKEHTAIVGGFSTYQSRSAFADVAKVLGLSEFQVRRFTENIPHTRAQDMEAAIAERQECRDMPLTEEPYRTAMKMAQFLDGFPRHPKMHPCGLVLSRAPMSDMVPCFTSNKGYPTAHFDMDSIEAIGLVKMDILAQGGLAVMRDVKQHLAGRGIEVDLRALEPWEDPEVWEMIASGGARAVHHIESPAMISLCRMCNVRDVDGLVAIVSVIRPGAANELKKTHFTRRYQGLEPIRYAHPSLEPCLRDTFGMVVYEEHILRICEAFAGLPPGPADVLRRALGKDQDKRIEEIREEFFRCARARGHAESVIAEVWKLVDGFRGYAFCKAHSTAYGVEAYQSAWLKRYYPVEFMAGVLTGGKGFYPSLVYALECHRLGIRFMAPWINEPGPAFEPHDGAIRVPAMRVKGLTERTMERLLKARERGEFESLRDFFCRVGPSNEEMEALARAGAFDGFGALRTSQFWEFQSLSRLFSDAGSGQACLFESAAASPPSVSLTEPERLERLKWEVELLGFPASGHPLELHPDIAWETYCPIARLQEHVGEEVTVCGLIVESRVHHQVTGEPMKFLTIADWTGMVETELFAKAYRSHGLATVRYPVLEITATVTPYENGRGCSLQVHRAGKPRNSQSPY